MEAYLDNAATTRVFPEVREKMVRVMEEDFGNPSSKHTKGMDAEKYIRETKEILAKDLKCTPGEIIFTSGGTESNNTALIGGAYANRRAGKHIITTRIEHASVHEPLAFLEELGYRLRICRWIKTESGFTERVRESVDGRNDSCVDYVCE